MALLVLGVGVVGLTEGLSTALRSARDSQLQSSAALQAAGVLETLRAEGYLVDGSSEGECTAGLGGYRWRRSIETTEIEGLHQVTVRVEDKRTGSPVCELVTLLFEVPSELPVRDRDRARDREAGGRRREQRGGGR